MSQLTGAGLGIGKAKAVEEMMEMMPVMRMSFIVVVVGS